MKIKSLVLCLILLSSNIFCQEYFTFNEKEIMTKELLLQKLEVLSTKANESNPKKGISIIKFNYRILSTIKRNDSIIHKVIFDPKFESTRTEKIYSYEKKSLPQFSLKNNKFSRDKNEDFKGKVTFINLWFTQCFPCVEEIPLLNMLQKKYKNKVNFVAITFDPKDKVNRFLKRKKFNFHHLVDAGKYLKEKLGNKAYPKIIILDKQGVVQYVGGGIPSEYDYEKRKMKERDMSSLSYLEDIIQSLE